MWLASESSLIAEFPGGVSKIHLVFLVTAQPQTIHPRAIPEDSAISALEGTRDRDLSSSVSAVPLPSESWVNPWQKVLVGDNLSH